MYNYNLFYTCINLYLQIRDEKINRSSGVYSGGVVWSALRSHNDLGRDLGEHKDGGARVCVIWEKRCNIRF